MPIEIKAPQFPESVPDGTIATWHVKAGDSVRRDAPLVDIETDKVVLEVVAPADGTLSKIIASEGDVVESNAVIGEFEAGDVAATPSAAGDSEASAIEAETPKTTETSAEAKVNPAAKKILSENNIDPSAVAGTGRGGRITKADVVNYLDQPVSAAASSVREEKRVPMSRLRARVAERLLAASQNTAMLTTFNEVNMKPVMEMRKQYKDVFLNTHGVKLGFMSFFVKACAEALKRFPAVNASIDGSDIVYHGYQDIGVAVSSDRGLVVPVLRDADQDSLAVTEKRIGEFGQKAQSGQLTIEDMTGGTFTISNGGVFGSMMSTPILNPPQTAILGMHRIQDRPMAVDGQVVILPMMYLALSYDHRLIDGKEAVQFLAAVKDMIEDPARILLEI